MSTTLTRANTAALPGRILFVDDDRTLLEGVERSLRPTREVWQCEFVEHPATALDLLQQRKFEVVVADMRMPGMTGAELLAAAKEVAPDTVRLMLTGNADLPTVLAAVNQAHVFQFLLKPCESNQLIQSVTAALLQHRLQKAERELLRMQLEQCDKMVIVGQIAAGLTHDLNNILGAILMQTELEMMDARNQAPVNPAFQLIHEAATSAAGLTRELNSFNRRDPVVMHHTLELPVVLESALRIARPMLKPKIKVHTELAATLPGVCGDANRLKHALMNLLLNARDAMPAGGVIQVRAEDCIFTAGATTRFPRRPGRFVCISVSDTGNGMSPEMQRQISEPFFTTKAPGQGTGLGLFMVRRTVQEHQGWMEWESGAGQGTTCRLYLPVSQDSQPRKSL